MSDPIELLTGQAWAMEEQALRRLVAKVRAAPTIKLDVQAAAAATRPASQRSLGVGVVPLHGVLLGRPGPWDWLFGASSVMGFMAELRAAANDRAVDSIILDVDSPGGSVDMVPEAADLVRTVGRLKPVVAVASTTMASAAYWIASQAGQVVASPSAIVGSIGVYTVHVDLSKALQEDGVAVTYIKAGRYKVEGNPHEPLGDTARSHIQEVIDDAYRQFVDDVARGRQTTTSAVRTGYGEGRALPAGMARQAKLVDRVAPFDTVLAGARASHRIAAHAFRAEQSSRAAAIAIGRRPLTAFDRERASRRRAGLRSAPSKGVTR